MKMILRYLETEKLEGGAETCHQSTHSRRSKGMGTQQREPDCYLTMLDGKLLNSTVKILASPIWPSFFGPSVPQQKAICLPCGTSPICFSMSAASSGVALGKIPGSVKLVLSREMITKINSTAPITGMKMVRCCTRNGQLWSGKNIDTVTS